MKLIVTEKNQTAKRVAEILSGGNASKDSGPRNTVYRYREDGEEVCCIGMRGHVCKVDFPREYSRWQKVDPRELISAEIVKSPSDEALVSKLVELAKNADSVVIATDFDREGELIGSDIREIIEGVKPGLVFTRARYSSLTSKEILESFSNLDTLDENLARAGEARQEIDLIWGAALTRFISLATRRLWRNFLSAGRVQSPTLALVVAREKEIRAFVPEDFWVLKVLLERDGKTFTAGHAADRFTDESEAKAAHGRLGDEGEVTEVRQKERSMKPPAPFNTTSFLAAASALRVKPSRAMVVAERLYTRGLISYPRVDNTVYPQTLDLHDVLRAMRGADVVGPLAGELLKKRKLVATRGRKESTDHPPIYPTGAATRDKLRDDEWKIYELVARRFLSTLSDAAVARSTRVDIGIGGEPFVAKGDVILEEGFLRYYPYSRKKDEELPDLAKGDRVRVVESEVQAKQTQPPARFSEGRLIEKMEEVGLGTKSTRHSIIQSLIDRSYVFGSPLKASETGIAVASALGTHATTVTTPDMTSHLEQEMDAIVEGQQSLQAVVDRSRDVLAGILDVMEDEKEEIAREILQGIKVDTALGECPECGGELLIKRARASGNAFVGCASFPACTVTYPLPFKKEIMPTGERCESCGKPTYDIGVKAGETARLCVDPNCGFNDRYADDAKLSSVVQELRGGLVLGSCPSCGNDIKMKRGKSGKRFAGCSGYPECDRTYPLPPKGTITATGNSCEECGSPRVRVLSGKKPWEICLDPECPTKPKREAPAEKAAGEEAPGKEPE